MSWWYKVGMGIMIVGVVYFEVAAILLFLAFIKVVPTNLTLVGGLVILAATFMINGLIIASLSSDEVSI